MERGKKVKEEKEHEKPGQRYRTGGCRKTAEDVCVLVYSVSHRELQGELGEGHK